jgi:hypothetical protein
MLGNGIDGAGVATGGTAAGAQAASSITGTNTDRRRIGTLRFKGLPAYPMDARDVSIAATPAV